MYLTWKIDPYTGPPPKGWERSEGVSKLSHNCLEQEPAPNTEPGAVATRSNTPNRSHGKLSIGSGRYPDCVKTLGDATGLYGGGLRWLLDRARADAISLRCHRLVRWSLTLLSLFLSGYQLAASVNLHGTSPWHPKNLRQDFIVAANVRLHRTSRWHLQDFSHSRYRSRFCSGRRHCSS
jgi:hypothetical protein